MMPRRISPKLTSIQTICWTRIWSVSKYSCYPWVLQLKFLKLRGKILLYFPLKKFTEIVWKRYSDGGSLYFWYPCRTTGVQLGEGGPEHSILRIYNWLTTTTIREYVKITLWRSEFAHKYLFFSRKEWQWLYLNWLSLTPAPSSTFLKSSFIIWSERSMSKFWFLCSLYKISH